MVLEITIPCEIDVQCIQLRDLYGNEGLHDISRKLMCMDIVEFHKLHIDCTRSCDFHETQLSILMGFW